MGKHSLVVLSAQVSDAAKGISPKVKYAALWAFLATLAMAALNGITPELLAPLGDWRPVVQNIIVAASAGIAGWKANDELRNIGGDMIDAARAELAEAEAAKK
jgi:hypothetical protein